MPRIVLARAIELALTAAEPPLKLAAGAHEVSEEVAGHWFVKANLADAETAAPKNGSMDFAEAARRVAAGELTELESRLAKTAADLETIQRAAKLAEEARAVAEGERDAVKAELAKATADYAKGLSDAAAARDAALADLAAAQKPPAAPAAAVTEDKPAKAAKGS